MIIKSVRIQTTASKIRLCDHIFRGGENENIEILQGSERDVDDLFGDAIANDSKFSIRHFIIAPSETMTRVQYATAVSLLADEFGFSPMAAIVVEHRKRRATEDICNTHQHILISELSPETGKILSSSNDFARHEYISRCIEHRFGHSITLGRHRKAVQSRLRQEGREDISAALEKAFPPETSQPVQAFSTIQHQMVKRRGSDLPAIRKVVKDAFVLCKKRSDLENALREKGLGLRPGEKAGEWIITQDNGFIGSLRRLAGATKSEVTELMEGKNVHQQRPTYGATDSRFTGNPDQDIKPGGRTGSTGSFRSVYGDPTERRRAELFASCSKLARKSSRWHRTNNRISRKNASNPPIASSRARSSSGSPAAIVTGLESLVMAMFALMFRSRAVSYSWTERVEMTLAEMERAASSITPVDLTPAQDQLKAAVENERTAAACEKQADKALSANWKEIWTLEAQKKGRFFSRFRSHRDIDERLTKLRETNVTLTETYSIVNRQYASSFSTVARKERLLKEQTAAARKQYSDAQTEIQMAQEKKNNIHKLISQNPDAKFYGSKLCISFQKKVEGDISSYSFQQFSENQM